MTRLAQPSPFTIASVTETVRFSAPVARTVGSDDGRPVAGMLLAAALAALLVAADQVIDSWTDGHLLAGWVALWTVTFVALALLASPLRRLANQGAQWLAAWKQSSAEARAEEELWELARHDHRVMTEIRMAAMRQRTA